MLQGSVTLKGGKSRHGSLLVVMGNTLSLLLSPHVLLSYQRPVLVLQSDKGGLSLDKKPIEYDE